MRKGAYHGRHAPHVGTRSPLSTEDNLGGPVLPRLDVVREVVVNPARVTKIGNLHADNLEVERLLDLALLARQRGVARLQRDTGHFPCEKIPSVESVRPFVRTMASSTEVSR